MDLSAAELPILHHKNNLKTIYWLLVFLLLFFYFAPVTHSRLRLNPGQPVRAAREGELHRPLVTGYRTTKASYYCGLKTQLIFYIYDECWLTNEHYFYGTAFLF